jgi:predicted helicase
VLTDYREALKAIRTFPSLIRFLRDEMDWPIESEDFEELTFAYSPEELGIDAKNAAKIQEIKRLRRLSGQPPWGIFFVKFEPKRLPVVALRRILSRVALKKRSSANSAERAAWSAADLLFVSNYGEGDSRQISFAHFSQSEARKDLPSLKVLGWDNLDTSLHLDHVAEVLTEQLVWPDDEENKDKWRTQWRSAFTLAHREVITTSKKLSIELASLARNIRDRINMVLAIETEIGPITKLMSAFKEALVHDLNEDGFADMYAQTIAYGLLSARVANPSGGTADDVAAAMPVTNPFLKELMETFLDVGGRKGKAGLDFDELGVNDVVELLDIANMEAVVRDFGDKNPQEDPVIHFYELFLKEYDAKKRMQRGVFYTPRPVVSFIVRSVDELLRTEFGLEDGLADTATWGEMTQRFGDLKIPEGVLLDQAFVQILDPATGTGTFLVEVIDLIHKTMTKKWRQEGSMELDLPRLWNDYVPEHLLPRLHGYELMMAPYAIAHMKIGLKLYETGYRFDSDERARVYLTNSLAPPQDFCGTLAFEISALAHEAEAVNAIKRDQRFTVVIGNPPYFAEAGRGGEWIAMLLRGQELESGVQTQSYFEVDGKSLEERTPKWLNDDYVKFFRLSQWALEQSGLGILSFITNHSYLDNPTFRGMRQSLSTAFDDARFIDLHGSSKKRESSPAGVTDSNVFDIQQGVAISLLVRSPSPRQPARILHSHLWGDRQAKYRELSALTAMAMNWEQIMFDAPLYLFIPQDSRLRAEYQRFRSISKIFPLSGAGMTTARDHVVIDFDVGPLVERAKLFRDSTATDGELCELLRIPEKKGWSISRSRELIREVEHLEDHLIPVLYRPLDRRLIFYHDSLVWRTAKAVMQHMISRNNVGLVATRQTKDLWGVTVTDCVIGHKACGAYDINSLFPLYLLSNGIDGFAFNETLIPNLAQDFLSQFAEVIGLEFKTPGPGDLISAFGPEDVFFFIYAVFHSVGYRTRYADFLKMEFPRVPLPGTLELLRSLVSIGRELVGLHLLRSTNLDTRNVRLVGSGAFRVEKVSYSDETVWIDKARTTGFRGVSEEVWNLHIGGYQVCEKWLKDRQAKGGKNPRPGRVLTDEDIDSYQRVVVALSGTIRIMALIDSVIETHGGWPDAFVPN